MRLSSRLDPPRPDGAPCVRGCRVLLRAIRCCTYVAATMPCSGVGSGSGSFGTLAAAAAAAAASARRCRRVTPFASPTAAFAPPSTLAAAASGSSSSASEPPSLSLSLPVPSQSSCSTCAWTANPVDARTGDVTGDAASAVARRVNPPEAKSDATALAPRARAGEDSAADAESIPARVKRPGPAGDARPDPGVLARSDSAAALRRRLSSESRAGGVLRDVTDAGSAEMLSLIETRPAAATGNAVVTDVSTLLPASDSRCCRST